jgi:hypothetical protein
MKALGTLILLSLLTIAFAQAHQPLASLVCVLALGFWLFNIDKILVLLWRNFTKPTPKRITKLDKGFQITQVEMMKPMDYLHDTYPNKNDAEILQIREAEMVKLLDDFCKGYDKSDHSKHFVFKAYYAYPNGKQELVAHFEPKTPIANEFLAKVMEHKMANGAYYEEDAED